MRLTENVGNIDRIIRSILVIAIIVILWTEILVKPFTKIVGIIAIVLAVTAVYRICPIYKLFKISTKK